MEGPSARVMDSVQPVHSWNDSQITDCLRAAARPSAMAVAADGGSAMRLAV